MPRRLEGKVAFITGAARGQGRSHAVRMAEEGADIIAVDICEPIETIVTRTATKEDLAETVRQVEAVGRQIVAEKADVRDFDTLSGALAKGVAAFGRLDIVSINAGIPGGAAAHVMSDEEWSVQIDIALKGAWHTAKAAIPHLIEGGRGGTITITSSAVTYRPLGNHCNYIAAKTGLIGLMRALALDLGPHSIRVNTLHPGTVASPMVMNENAFRHFCPDIENPTVEDFKKAVQGENVLPAPYVEMVDVSNALVFLASDEARLITGVDLPIDAGWRLKPGTTRTF